MGTYSGTAYPSKGTCRIGARITTCIVCHALAERGPSLLTRLPQKKFPPSLSASPQLAHTTEPMEVSSWKLWCNHCSLHIFITRPRWQSFLCAVGKNNHPMKQSSRRRLLSVVPQRGHGVWSRWSLDGHSKSPQPRDVASSFVSSLRASGSTPSARKNAATFPFQYAHVGKYSTAAVFMNHVRSSPPSRGLRLKTSVVLP